MTSLALKMLHVPLLAGEGVGMRGLVWFFLLLGRTTAGHMSYIQRCQTHFK